MMRHHPLRQHVEFPEARESLFRAGHNCWRANRLHQAALLIDCANYYRALHSSILKARHSIFILGWDIDSRVRLLRGEDEKNATAPSIARELLAFKARQNPNLKIHLLRWDSSFMFMTKREFMAEWAWGSITPPNVHVMLDETIPAGGSHHQKIVLIDDEIAFTGGMDIAIERWDNRSHDVQNPERIDAGVRYEPYHDVQIVVSGPVVKDFSELVRWRWRRAAGYAPLPVNRNAGGSMSEVPPSWPKGVRPYIFDAPCALARTIPHMWDGTQEIFEVREMYLDLIRRARHFIYAENQFLSSFEIADALNRQLTVHPDLRALLISSYDPKGLFESEVFWAGRVGFNERLQKGISPERARITYSVTYDKWRRAHYKRIHSKVLTVDDDYLVVASSNLNNRSMVIDTECDLVIEAETLAHRHTIACVRDDLIAEHSGLNRMEIASLIRGGAPLSSFTGKRRKNRTVLRTETGNKFRRKSLFHAFARLLADPDKPLMHCIMPLRLRNVIAMKNPAKRLFLFAVLIFLLAVLGIVLLNKYATWLQPEVISDILNTYRNTRWALPLVCGIYMAAGLVAFPVTILTLITAVVFGPLWGPVYAMYGALASAALLFGIGHKLGFKMLRKYIGEKIRNIDNKIQKNGILGVALIRLVPVAPYSFINLAAGISSVRFGDFMAGTFLGLLPGLIAKGLVGDSMVKAFLNPSLSTLIYLFLGIMIWIVLALGAQRLALRLRDRLRRSRG